MPRAGFDVHRCVAGIVAFAWLATLSSASRSIVTGNHYGDVWWLEDLDSADTTKRTWQQKNVGAVNTLPRGTGLAQAPGPRGSVSALVVHYVGQPEGRVFDMTDPRNAGTFFTNAVFPTPASTSSTGGEVATAPDGPCLPPSEATSLAFVAGTRELLCIERTGGAGGSLAFKSRFILPFPQIDGEWANMRPNTLAGVVYDGRGRVYVTLMFVKASVGSAGTSGWDWPRSLSGSAKSAKSGDPTSSLDPNSPATANLEWRVFSANATAVTPHWTREGTVKTVGITSTAGEIRMEVDERAQDQDVKMAALGVEVYVLIQPGNGNGGEAGQGTREGGCVVKALSTGKVTKLTQNSGNCQATLHLAASQGRLYVVFDSGAVLEIEPSSGAQRVVVAAASISMFRVYLSGMAILNDCTPTPTPPPSTTPTPTPLPPTTGLASPAPTPPPPPSTTPLPTLPPSATELASPAPTPMLAPAPIPTPTVVQG